MADAASKAQIIKQVNALIAKHKVCDENNYPVSMGVHPHPANRGGNAINSMKCKELISQIVEDGFDPIEANMNGVCVAATENNLQNAFVKDIEGAQDDIAATDGSAALAGSLSHSHLKLASEIVDLTVDVVDLTIDDNKDAKDIDRFIGAEPRCGIPWTPKLPPLSPRRRAAKAPRLTARDRIGLTELRNAADWHEKCEAMFKDAMP